MTLKTVDKPNITNILLCHSMYMDVVNHVLSSLNISTDLYCTYSLGTYKAYKGLSEGNIFPPSYMNATSCALNYIYNSKNA